MARKENSEAMDAAELLCAKVEDILGDLPFYTAKHLQELIMKFREAREREKSNNGQEEQS